ncbi:MAG: hypothetical protein ACRDSR_22135 [Pseudonocardiaceae bacterium]
MRARCAAASRDAPPIGSDTFELGVTVRQDSGGDIRLDVRTVFVPVG